MSESALLELRFQADPSRLASVRARVRAVAAALVHDARWVADVVMAVNEACVNVIQHAYQGNAAGEIVLKMRQAGVFLEIALLDFAPPVLLENIRPRALDDIRPGGLGTHFIRTLMDRCEYANLDGGQGNLLRMQKRLREPTRHFSSGDLGTYS